LDRFCPGDRAAARRSLGVAEGEALVLYVGRLDREKSVDRVLVAFDRIASTVAAARLVLVGHGTEAERLRRQARALPVARRIRFLLGLGRRRGMARRAREVAEREFDVRLQIDRTMAVYLDAIARVR